MNELLFWLYLCNATVIMCHEIESAYWKEWEMFRLPGGLTGFIVLHIPLVFLILWGLVEVRNGSMAGLVISFFLTAGSIGAALIHTWFIKRGGKEFSLPISRIILLTAFLLSVVQCAVTINIILK